MLFLSALLLATHAGCSPSHQLETAEVHGTVTLDGRPVTAGGVMFLPDRGRGATAKISSDGTYRLTTYVDGDGAIVGKHQVSILPPYAAGETDLPSAPAQSIPARYHNGGSSRIEVEVQAGQVNVVDLKLTTSALAN